MVRRNLRHLDRRFPDLGLGAWPRDRVMIELPYGLLNSIFVALIVFAQLNRSRSARTNPDR
jgi:hypothetical protein